MGKKGDYSHTEPDDTHRKDGAGPPPLRDPTRPFIISEVNALVKAECPMKETAGMRHYDRNGDVLTPAAFPECQGFGLKEAIKLAPRYIYSLI